MPCIISSASVTDGIGLGLCPSVSKSKLVYSSLIFVDNKLASVCLSHARTVVRECCKGDDESQWERGKFDPPPSKNPLTDGHQNLCR